MPIPRDRLFDCASALLTCVKDYYDFEGEPFPERYYVSPGLPAWDCEQAVVYVERTFSGSVATEEVAVLDCLLVRSAIIVVEIARCTPSVESSGADVRIPSPAEEEDSAQQVLADPLLIVNAAVAAFRAGQLAGCRGLSIVEWESLGPEGGFAGGRQRFRWQLTEGVGGSVGS